MELEMNSLAELLSQESDYSGKFYHLSPPESEGISFEWLCDSLEGKEIEVKSEVDIQDENLHIPDIFQSDEDIDRASFGEIHKFKDSVEGILGMVRHNKPDTVVYNNQEVLILQSHKTKFVIFEKDSQYYLSMLGRRSLVSAVLDLIKEELHNLGFSVDDATIHHSEFEDIEEDLVDNLRTTRIRGYPSPSIEAKDIRGFGFEDAHEYERELREGSIHGHRFETTQLDESGPKTIQISGDGLVRCYNNISLSSYLDMLGNYIVPNVSQYQQSLYAYGSEKTNSSLSEFNDKI
jgi:hypothetical protein